MMVPRRVLLPVVQLAGLIAVGFALAGCASTRLPPGNAAVHGSPPGTARSGASTANGHQSGLPADELARARATPSPALPAAAPAPRTPTPSGRESDGYPGGSAPDFRADGHNTPRDPSAAAPGSGYPSHAESVDSIDPGHRPLRSSNAAVNALLAQADGSRRGGNLSGAIASAERALRIAPADPVVYYELALLRLANSERGVAEQLARKGLSCQPDEELRQRLQDLIARARMG